MPNESCFVRSAHFNRGKGNARGGVLQAQNGGTHKRLRRSPCLRAEKGELGRGLKSSVSFRANSPLVENVIIAFLLAVPKSEPTFCTKPQTLLLSAIERYAQDSLFLNIALVNPVSRPAKG